MITLEKLGTSSLQLEKKSKEPSNLFSRRFLQLSLGSIWILDAFLQLQPYMLNTNFLPQSLLSSAAMLPSILREPIYIMQDIVAAHIIFWDLLLAIVQFVIGIGIIWPRTTKIALAISVVWAVSIWYGGEGMGGIFAKGASVFFGAPGAALLYAVLALIIWPKNIEGKTLIEASLVPSIISRGIWMTIWIGGAFLPLLPWNSPYGVMKYNFLSLPHSEPKWLVLLDRNFESFSLAYCNEITIFLLLVMVLIGINIAMDVNPKLWVKISIFFSVISWVLGQNFGGIFTGQGTDINSAPILILFALTFYPIGRSFSDSRTSSFGLSRWLANDNLKFFSATYEKLGKF